MKKILYILLFIPFLAYSQGDVIVIDGNASQTCCDLTVTDTLFFGTSQNSWILIDGDSLEFYVGNEEVMRLVGNVKEQFIFDPQSRRVGDINNPAIAITPTSGFYLNNSNSIGISIDSAQRFYIDTLFLGKYSVLKNEASTLTNPNILPLSTDTTSGIGYASAVLSFISKSISIMTADSNVVTVNRDLTITDTLSLNEAIFTGMTGGVTDSVIVSTASTGLMKGVTLVDLAGENLGTILVDTLHVLNTTASIYHDAADTLHIDNTAGYIELGDNGLFVNTTDDIIIENDLFYNPPHCHMNYADSTVTLDLTLDDWIEITNATTNLYIKQEFDDMTFSGDTVVVSKKGDYDGIFKVSFDAASSKDYEFRVMQNLVQVEKSIVSTGINQDFASEVIPFYFDGEISDKIYVQIRNITDNTDVILHSGIIIVKALHLKQ